MSQPLTKVSAEIALCQNCRDLHLPAKYRTDFGRLQLQFLPRKDQENLFTKVLAYALQDVFDNNRRLPNRVEVDCSISYKDAHICAQIVTSEKDSLNTAEDLAELLFDRYMTMSLKEAMPPLAVMFFGKDTQMIIAVEGRP